VSCVNACDDLDQSYVHHASRLDVETCPTVHSGLQELMVLSLQSESLVTIPCCLLPSPTFTTQGLPLLASIGFGTRYMGSEVIGSPGGLGSGGAGALASPGKLRALGDSGIGEYLVKAHLQNSNP
jgi:hypothetical protein